MVELPSGSQADSGGNGCTVSRRMMIKAHEAEQPRSANEFVQHEGPCSHYSRVTQAANTARGRHDHHAIPVTRQPPTVPPRPSRPHNSGRERTLPHAFREHRLGPFSPARPPSGSGPVKPDRGLPFTALARPRRIVRHVATKKTAACPELAQATASPCNPAGGPLVRPRPGWSKMIGLGHRNARAGRRPCRAGHSITLTCGTGDLAMMRSRTSSETGRRSVRMKRSQRRLH